MLFQTLTIDSNCAYTCACGTPAKLDVLARAMRSFLIRMGPMTDGVATLCKRLSSRCPRTRVHTMASNARIMINPMTGQASPWSPTEQAATDAMYYELIGSARLFRDLLVSFRTAEVAHVKCFALACRSHYCSFFLSAIIMRNPSILSDGIGAQPDHVKRQWYHALFMFDGPVSRIPRIQ